MINIAKNVNAGIGCLCTAFGLLILFCVVVNLVSWAWRAVQ